MACATEVIVVRVGDGPHELECGGHPMVPHDQEGAADQPLVPGHDEGTLTGKRYTDEQETIELLCTKPGAGSLALGGVPLAVKGAKPLPASD